MKSTNYYFLNDIEFQQMINTSKTLELKEYFKIIANDKPLERQIEYWVICFATIIRKQIDLLLYIVVDRCLLHGQITLGNN